MIVNSVSEFRSRKNCNFYSYQIRVKEGIAKKQRCPLQDIVFHPAFCTFTAVRPNKWVIPVTNYCSSLESCGSLASSMSSGLSFFLLRMSFKVSSIDRRSLLFSLGTGKMKNEKKNKWRVRILAKTQLCSYASITYGYWAQKCPWSSYLRTQNDWTTDDVQ